MLIFAEVENTRHKKSCMAAGVFLIIKCRNKGVYFAAIPNALAQIIP